VAAGRGRAEGSADDPAYGKRLYGVPDDANYAAAE
jgi:hypothetical protein